MINRQVCYSSQFKTMVMLDLLQNQATIMQIATKYKISIASIWRWKKELIKNASKIFSTTNTKNKPLEYRDRDHVNLQEEGMLFKKCFFQSENKVMKYNKFLSLFEIS